ncbi:MAG: class I SAM-dependent methyltransferase [Alphaproteobacteria bacterium]|nr:class I SAM-dependent methyltransferase [Alphaproteobacteria bacterium]
MLARLLGTYRLEPSPAVEAAIRVASDFEDFDLQPLVRSAIDCLLAKPDWKRLAAAAGEDHAQQIGASLDAGQLAPFDDPLLRNILMRGVCHDVPLERVLLALRAGLAARAPDSLPAGWQDVAGALACQAANNEYAWPTEPVEDQTVERLAERIAGAALPDDSDILRAAMYRAPSALPGFALWRIRPMSPAVRAVLAATGSEDQVVSQAVRQLGPAQGSGSQRVQAQYEENPYPRWLALNPPAAGERRARLLARCPAADRPRFEGPIDVLIAGCGTGRQAITAALGYGQPSHLTAIDLSAASLAYAARMARRYGTPSIEFVQVDLLDIDRLDRDFDVIEAIGVLHHLADPGAGWRALARRVKPGGLMNVALYSERGRQDVVAARHAIAALAIEATPQGIRRLRRLVLDAPADARDWRATVRRFTDFFTLSGCRDLLFNVLEHRFTPLAIHAMLRELDLELLSVDVPAATLARYRSRFPGDPAGLDLQLWDRFEADNPTIFSGMIGIWCRSNAASGQRT